MRNINTKLNYKRRKVALILGTMLIVSTLFYSVSSLAHWYGITGQTNDGCTCHGSSNSNTILIPSIQSGIWSVMAGSTSTITINLSNSNRAHAGIDIAVKTTSGGNIDAGSLATISGDGLQLLNSELTHTNPIPYTGGSHDFQFTWTAPSTPGTYYLQAAGNAVDSNNQNTNDQWNFMSTKAIIVTAPPSVTVTSPNGGEAWCAGTARNITWTYQTVSNVKIELSTNGGNTFDFTLQASTPASAGSWSWAIPSNQSVGNNYKIRISDAAASSTFDVSDNNFAIAPVTSITQQPQNVTACTGAQAQLSLVAAGNSLSYQWVKDGINIPGSNSASYTIISVTAQSAGNYDCIVTGACGSPVTSSLATVTVNISPNITTQPVSKIACTGQSVSFSVVAEGTNLTYQWKKNGQNIPGKTTSILTLDNITTSDEGAYQVVVSGSCEPSVSSQTVSLTVPQMPLITTDPKSQTICEGSKLLLTVQALGSNLTYSWWKDNAEIANSNNDSLIITNAELTDKGIYSVVVSTDCSLSATSAQATVTINPKPVITKQPTDLVVSVGQKAELSVTATGGTLQYQWTKDGTNISNANQSKYTIDVTKVEDSGNYLCKVTNSCGEVSSKQAKLTVQQTAGAVLSFSENPLDLGKVENGKVKDLTIQNAITNIGVQDLVITSFSITGTDAADFEILNLTLPQTLKQGDKSNLTIRFKPTAAGAKTATVNFTSNSSISNELILIAFSANINIGLSSSELLFNFNGKADTVVDDLHIINNSNTDLGAILTINGTDASSFRISSADTIKVLQNEDHVAKITFLAPDIKDYQANLLISFPEVNFEKNVKLTATYINSVFENSTDFSFEIIPNPALNGIIFSFGKLSGTNLEIQIYNENGVKVNTLYGKDMTDNSQILWDLLDSNGITVPSGLYNALIIIDNKIYRKPVLIVK